MRSVVAVLYFEQGFMGCFFCGQEICAICSAVPLTLIMCNDCPRSFCNECLDRLLTTEQQHQMNTKDIWRCFLCIRKGRTARQAAGGSCSDALIQSFG